MHAKIINGREIASTMRSGCRAEIAGLKQRHGVVPGLVVVLVGDDAASQVYVRNKIRACAEVGIESTKVQFPKDVDPDLVIRAIEGFNRDPSVHGILVQLPLPGRLSLSGVLRAISREKDVDGFHLYNVGSLVIGDTIFPPCTPFGVIKILEHERVAIEGANAVVVGASNIVGKPMALMLMQRGATVSICHIKTRDLSQYTLLADLLVVAAGQCNLIRPHMVKPGAVVVDVGINRLGDGRLVGDVDFEGVREKASRITPVPGGVGPMTVTMLLVNTIAAAKRSAEAAVHCVGIEDESSNQQLHRVG